MLDDRSKSGMNIFSEAIVEWYKEYKRDLPWREFVGPVSDLDIGDYSPADTGGAGIMITFSGLSNVFLM